METNMEATAYDIRQADTLAAWQQALAEVPQTPALSGALLRRRPDLFGRFAAWYGRLRSRPRAERRRWQRQLGLSLAGIALLLAVNGAPAGAAGPAATISVDGVTCTLADAITAANTNVATGGCTAGGGADTLNLTANIVLTAALPNITTPVTIEGNGHTISRQAGSPDFRILTVSGANLTLNSATISGGTAVVGGGVLASLSTVSITNSVIVGNSANQGGGLRSDTSTLTVTNSTISGNTAFDSTGRSGGGILASGSPVTILNSTISGNSVGGASAGQGQGGGIYQISNSLVVTNSTISGNSAGNNGGGIRISSGTLIVTNSTISGNSTGSGGGITTNGPTVTIINSTVSGNTASLFAGGIYRFSGAAVTVRSSIVAGQASGGDCNTTLTTGGYNIESGTTCGFTGTGDLQNVSSGSLALGALANNGGPTQTRALGAGSVAIDRIPVGALEANGCGVTVTADQRGAPRAGGAGNGGSACDVGAYEAGSTPLAVTLASFAAQAMVDRIQLSWETVSEANNAGFNLYRSTSPAAPDALLAYVPSQAPGSTQGASYSFDDTEVAAGQTWYYWLEDVDLSGATSLHGPVSATLQAPTAVTVTAMEAQAASPGGNVSAWGALLAGLIGVAGALGVRRRSRA
jgi:hypothetical protein